MPLDINFTTIPLLRCYPNLAVLDDQQPHWKTRAEIKDSICEEDAGMCNYAIDEDSLALWQKMRAIQIAERRDEILWQRQHGLGPGATTPTKTEISGSKNRMQSRKS